jgi:hypothetical protein
MALPISHGDAESVNHHFVMFSSVIANDESGGLATMSITIGALLLHQPPLTIREWKVEINKMRNAFGLAS